MTLDELVCCCNRTCCESLLTNNSILDVFRNDVREAGTLGQALLARHQQYISETEKDRTQLLDTMVSLRYEKSTLEATNARIVEENRALLDQLENLNNSVADSDTHIESLSQTLNSTRQELFKLSSLAKKAAQLEIELSALETERMRLDSELVACKADEHAAVQKWRKAELTMSRLQQQIEEIQVESTSCNPQKERQYADSSVIEEAQAPKSTPDNEQTLQDTKYHEEGAGTRNGVVSHFVKDILQDNSNLQVENLELREMLSVSNNELKNLRGQFESDLCTTNGMAFREYKPLGLEIQDADERKCDVVPELHVHHHYHQQKPEWRKNRRRRSAILVASARHDPRDPYLLNWNESRTRPQQLAPVVESEISDTDSIGLLRHRPNASVHSAASGSSYAPSSLSTSPKCLSTIFDTFEHNANSTQMSTPISSAPGSPRHTAQLSSIDTIAQQGLENRGYTFSDDHDSTSPLASTPIVDTRESTSFTSTRSPFRTLEPSVYRIKSQESFLSISGMDIHTTKHLMSPNYAVPTSMPKPATVSRSIAIPQSHAKPELTAAIAISSMPSTHLQHGSAISKRLLEHHVASQTVHKTPLSLNRMGVWIFGNRKSTNPQAEILTEQHRMIPDGVDVDLYQPAFRSTGVNQPGLVLGLYAPQNAPVNIVPRSINTELLQESLKDN